jgi:hypothetical protein
VDVATRLFGPVLLKLPMVIMVGAKKRKKERNRRAN